MWCQGQVIDTHLVAARASINGQGQLQAYWQLYYPGYLCAFTWLYNLPLGICTAVEASGVYEPGSVQAHTWSMCMVMGASFGDVG